MTSTHYLMESEDESIRLDLKTDPRWIRKHARWAGIKMGMRVGDFGCGPGKTSYYLNRMVQPSGSVLGIDISQQRIDYAENHYHAQGLRFVLGDIRNSLSQFGLFDFIWIRFVLEHYRSSAYEIVRNTVSALKPGGILCLIDLDYNCLTHHELSPKLEKAIPGLMHTLEQQFDFDPYIGRKLYSYLYDLEFSNIRVDLSPYHLFYGQVHKTDLFNWSKKLEVAARRSEYQFQEFENGFKGFYSEFQRFFSDPRRFTYTPIICCCGIKGD